MRVLRLSLEGLGADDRAIYIDQLREHWRLDAWTVAGQLLVLLALGPVIRASGLPWWAWGPAVALLLGSWAWAARAPWRLRHIQINDNNYPRWRARTLWRELSQSLGWALLSIALWGALDEQWHLLILTGLLVFIYTAMFFTTHDTGVAVVASTPILLMLSARLVLSDGQGHRLIALILTVSALTCLAVGRLIEQRLLEAERLRRRNEALLAELAREIDHVRQARDDAERANRQKSHFLATASHDLRQPLHSLTLLAGLMHQEDDAERLRHTAGRMQTALEGLRFVFDQLFDMARLEAGKHPHHPRALAVAPLLESLHAELAPTFEARALGWHCHPVPATLGCMADPVFVQRTLRNLLDNALRYTTQGQVCVRARLRGNCTVLQVWDTGCGIAREAQATIFDDYVQGHNTQRQRSQGLGLGLAVVRRLADAGSYRVTVRSRPGRGSCFSVWLPACPAPAATPTVLGARTAQPATPPLLALVEDDDDVRQTTCDIMRQAGWQVAAGASSQDVIERIAQVGQMPAAILSDHRLGDQEDGLQAIATLRHEFGLAVPAALVTGDLDATLPGRCDAHQVLHLRKPIDRGQLIAVLEGWRPPNPTTHPSQAG